MNHKISVLTTIFPMPKEYLDDFFVSLQKQTCKNFDVIVVNDGYDNFHDIKAEYGSLNIIELNYSDTPAKNREFGINYVKSNQYEVLILGDSDDYFSSNRIQVSIDKLKTCDVLVNDITLFDKEGAYDAHYFSKRIKNNDVIGIDYIKDKNIFGLSNTALRVKAIGRLGFAADLVAVDWFFFSVLLSEGKKAVFTNEAITFYRQYVGNITGLGKVTGESILNGIDVKLKHYQLMKKGNHQFEGLYQDMVGACDNVDLSRVSKLNCQNLFWWEVPEGIMQ